MKWLPLTLLVAAVALPGLTRAGSAPVTVEICEDGLNDKDAWPDASPAATESFSLPAFALDLLPQKYVDDGVRGARPSPSLVRMRADVAFPAGRHRLLIRARSAARLIIDGRTLAQTPFPPNTGEDGSEKNPQKLIPLDLGPGYRFTPRGEFESMVDFETPGGRFPVVYEAFVGGRLGKNPRRVEPGETVVAISRAGQSGWELLSPAAQAIPYTDDAWQDYHARLRREFSERDTASRARLRSAQDAYWNQRHQAAQAWLASTKDVPVPGLPTGFTAANAIDHFIADRLTAIAAQNAHATPGAVDFFRDVKPLLEARCIDCHRGDKAKGGLRLETLALARQGGDSGSAIEPGAPAKSELLRRVRSHDSEEVMPPKGNRLTDAEVSVLERWVKEGASWPELPLARREPTPLTDDLTFLRRVMLDTVGVPPTAEEARKFAADVAPDKRNRLIDRLLADPRWADHWISMWQDVLAENPNILNPTLNNTGPFRWWLYEALQDDLPLDRMVTQLVRQRGSDRDGGPAGFAIASQNDAPFAAKGTIVSAAFLGLDLKCARCHDSATGSTRQEQLFQLGAMLATKPLDVPKTSSVDPAKLTAGGRKPLISVTLKPGTKVAPAWPFPEFVQADAATPFLPPGADSRDQLAALLTAPQNERFAQVIVNRIWHRLMGRGIVDPVDDWEKGTPTHPELLRWLAREFVRHGYQARPIARLILQSHAYQRATDPTLRNVDLLYAAPAPRRLHAEQVVDSLFATIGKPFRTEPVCLDLNGRRDVGNSVDLGQPHRAWMLSSLSNERDRPSLTLPRLQAVADVMTALGWRGSRQDPTSIRETAPNALQPAILANGVMMGWLTRLSDDHGLTQLAISSATVESLVEEIYLRILTRPPTGEELARAVAHLRPGFAERVASPAPAAKRPHQAIRLVTWTNHLLPESDLIKREEEEAARRGDPPTAKLDPAWRARCEDVIWAVLNSPEMLYRP